MASASATAAARRSPGCPNSRPARAGGICAWPARSGSRKTSRDCGTKMRNALLFTLTAATLTAQMNDISGARIRAHVKFLSLDLLEGRGTGARGGDLATEYIAAQLALIGAKPAGDKGTYFQNFTLVGVEPLPTTALTAIGSGGQQTFRWLD